MSVCDFADGPEHPAYNIGSPTCRVAVTSYGDFKEPVRGCPADPLNMPDPNQDVNRKVSVKGRIVAQCIERKFPSRAQVYQGDRVGRGAHGRKSSFRGEEERARVRAQLRARVRHARTSTWQAEVSHELRS